MILEAVQFILGLGPTVMLPIVITIIGMAFGQGFKKAFRSGLTIGVGFVGINLVIGLLTSNLGDATHQMVTRYGLQLNIIDVGWPAAAAMTWASPVAAAMTWASPVAAIMIPICMAINIAMLVTFWASWPAIL